MKPNLKEQSIIVCSIVRNAAKGLRRNIPIINRLCALFKTYDIIVYENDSTDNTRELLINWKQYNKSNIHIICEDVESSSTVPSSSEVRCNPFFSKKRIAKMAYLRNKYMKYIDENKLVADYIVIVDLDVAELYLEGIVNSFEIEKEWDVICAYGYSLGPSLRRRYHDTYALSLHGESNMPQTEKFIFELPRKLAKDFNNSSDLYPVDSAFGGLAIYKFNAIQGLRYKVIDNDDSRVEVRCEHFSLNRQAAERGYTRIFINPEMKLKYQSISLQQINKRIISVVRCILKTILTKKIINIQCPPLYYSDNQYNNVYINGRIRVLVVATSRKTRGGITSVIKAHETGEQWKKFHCHWVQTHRDGPAWRKILYLIVGMIDFLIRLPFYDIVHIHISQPTTVKRKALFLWFAKQANKRIIVHFHAYNVEETILGKTSKKYLQFFTTSDKVIVLSSWWKQQLVDVLNVSASKINILQNPCPQVNEVRGVKENFILYAGTIDQRKGYVDLIRSFSVIASKYPNWKLVLAGNGEVENAKSLSKELNIETQVDFVGWIFGEKKDKIFRKARIFCLPSYAEGFPMAVLDAWAYGLPVITTPVGGIPDVAVDGENMLLFNPGDVNKLAENIEILITDTDIRERISQASLAFAKGQFNITTINNELGLIYASLNRYGI